MDARRLWLAAALTLAISAQADVVRLKSGGMVEGVIVKQTKTQVVVQTNSGGKVTLRLRDVATIERKPSAFQIYRDMLAKLSDDDADGHYSLGLWCQEHRLFRQAREQFEKTIAINPNHKGARERLGYVLLDGKWVTKAEAMKANGFVLHRGEWLTAEQLAEKKNRQAAIAWANRLKGLLARAPRNPDTAEQLLRREIGKEPSVAAQMALRSILAEMVEKAEKARTDRDNDLRLALARLVGDQKDPKATALLRRCAMHDPDLKVRQAAVVALAEQHETENTAYFVALLRRFTSEKIRLSGSARLRRTARLVLKRAAQALQGLGDPRAIPALARAMIVHFYVPKEDDAGPPPVTIGFSTTTYVGGQTFIDPFGNEFVIPLTEGSNWGLEPPLSDKDPDESFFFNTAAYEALRAITGQDFGHDKRAWLAWWYRNRHNLED